MEPSDYPPYEDDDGPTTVLSGVDLGAFFAGRYRVDEELGSGAMGKVLRATDMTNDRPVAIKVLHADKATKKNVIDRFRREAEILSAVGHHGIVEILGFGTTDDGTDYLVMEHIDGTSLKQHLREHGPMRPDELLPLLIILCDAIGAAHDRGVIHRDLKPENVMLFQRGGEPRVKVLDFGLSRMGTEKRLTATGTMIGTPRYMAPEQIRSAKDVDERTDIYACGVVVYEALTGQSPFPAEDAGQLLGCVIENRITPLCEVRPELPPALGDVVRRAMAKLPEDRFVTMNGFAEAFAAALGRSTGRKDLLAKEGFDAPVTASGEIEIPRFTRPPDAPRSSVGSAPARVRKKRSMIPFVLLGVFGLGCLLAIGLGLAYRFLM